MTSQQSYITWFVFLLSQSLCYALDRTIRKWHLAGHWSSASILWCGSLLIFVVFFVGLYHIRKATPNGQEQPSFVPADRRAAWPLLFACLFFGLATILRVQSVFESWSVPQVPLALKLAFACVTSINLSAFCWWSNGVYKEWLAARRQNRGLRQEADGDLR